MSQEAIDMIAQAEEKARSIKANAAADAKRMINQAHAAGKLAVEAAGKKAANELHELVKRADEKSTADAVALAATTENKKAGMRVKAEHRLDDAARIIAERIVSSQ